MAGWNLRVASNAAASTWQDITGYIERTTARFTGMAFDGQIGQGGVDLDDQAGNLVIPGYRVWELEKDGLILERGRIGIKDYERGVNRTADSHEREITLIDCNADLSRIGVHNWSRPAETGRARVLALISAYLNGSPRASTVIGSAWVRNANTRTMPAKRYDNANPHEVLTDCAEVEAKIFFVTVADDGTMDLFYDISTYTGYAAGISITDDDPDRVTEFPPIHPTASRDPEELFSNVRLTYDGGASVTADNSSVATDHDYLETIYYDDAATASTAQYRADRFLDIHDEEETTRRCSVAVPEASLDQIRRGMTISYRAAATNDLTPITRRIAQLTWAPPIADGQAWTAILELDWPLKIGQRYTKPKPPTVPRTSVTPYTMQLPVLLHTYTRTKRDGIAHTSVDASYSGEWLLDPANTGSQVWGGVNAIVGVDNLHLGNGLSLPADPANVHNHDRQFVSIGLDGDPFYAHFAGEVTITDSAGLNRLFEIVTGTWGLTNTGSPPAYAFAGETIASGSVLTGVGFTAFQASLNVAGLDRFQFVLHNLTDPVSSNEFSFLQLNDPAVADGSWTLRTYGEGATQPATGQPVARHVLLTSDGTTDTFTTTYEVAGVDTTIPYLPGSLEVWVDGIAVVPIESDPTTGEFMLSFTPAVGDEIAVAYRAA